MKIPRHIVSILMLFAVLIWIACDSTHFINTKRRLWESGYRGGDPMPQGWAEYIKAVEYLQKVGDRKRAADLFEEITTKYPNCPYAPECQELSDLLRKMVEKDKTWQEPADVSELSIDEQINYYIYKLREVNCRQLMQPGFCSVLLSWLACEISPEMENAAIKLSKIGKPAIPTLINLLNDRRPIRSFGYWRSYFPTRVILRYQDAAIEILEAILSKEFYDMSSWGAYFSTENPKLRQKIIADIKSWWEKHKQDEGKDK